MSLLVLLGTGLVSLLRNGISIWDTAESRGVAYDRARAVLERVADDLRSAVARAGPTAGHSWVRFVCDLGPEGKQRLRFVRTIAGEAADPFFREGGKLLTSRGGEVYDGLGGAPERDAGYLAAPAGLMEVLYTLDPRPGAKRLWRGVRSPIGGPGSLFVDENLEADGKASRLEEVAVPVSDDVLFLGFRFWTWGTNTWKPVSTKLPLPRDRPPPASVGWRSADRRMPVIPFIPVGSLTV